MLAHEKYNVFSSIRIKAYKHQKEGQRRKMMPFEYVLNCMNEVRASGIDSIYDIKPEKMCNSVYSVTLYNVQRTLYYVYSVSFMNNVLTISRPFAKGPLCTYY